LKARNALVDPDRRIQIADWSAIRLESGEVEPFAREESAPAADICAFVSFLVEIAMGASGGLFLSAAVLGFVWRMIDRERSLVNIVDHLEVNRFQIVASADCAE
jgi:hypothetical protein